ncbi:MAG TPA: pentapeptide repeat-containing protein [Kofleriaceae bacterium]
MTVQEGYSRHTAIDTLLSVARRELLVVEAANCATDDDAAAIASARLRWAIGSARKLIEALGAGARAERHGDQLDRIANRAQRCLLAEPPSLQEIGGLVDRVSARRAGRGSEIVADDAAVVDLDLDDLDLPRISLRGASLTEVTLRRTGCVAADARSSRWLRCQLEHGSLAMAVLAGAQLEHCDLSRANLEGTSWHRATLAHCVLRGAVLIDARLEHAVFTDCDLRGADLAIARSPNVATLAGARFVRCDLRDTRWAGRELGAAVFVDCLINSLVASRRPGLRSAP